MTPRHLVLTAGVLGALASGLGVARDARADRTFLVGGTVIEGRATRKGDKVVVEVESGEVTLPAESVARIEKSESVVSKFAARYAALRPGDVKGRLDLADYCRDHDMRGRERTLLFEVLETDTNNSAARARLGYVKTDAGWVTQADAMRAKGMVQHDGQWMTPAEGRDLDRAHAEAESQARHREEEDAEMAARRAQLATEEADFDAARDRLASQANSSYYSPYGYGSYYAPVYGSGVRGRAFEPTVQRRGAPTPGSPTPGSRAFDSSMSVVKVPYRRH